LDLVSIIQFHQSSLLTCN